MTGHQDHPGTGITLMGQGTHAASIEAFAQACGIENVVVCSPFDLKEMQHAIQEELLKPGPSLILSKAPCPLHPRLRKQPRKIDPDRCRNCRLCVGCGCPAIEAGNDSEKPRINESICNGCLLCEKICPFGAVSQL